MPLQPLDGRGQTRLRAPRLNRSHRRQIRALNLTLLLATHCTAARQTQLSRQCVSAAASRTGFRLVGSLRSLHKLSIIGSTLWNVNIGRADTRC